MIEVARKLNPALRIEQATVSCLPFPDSSFDVVIAIEVLRYLDTEHAALFEMLRVIKPGGQLIFTATSPVSLCLFPLINQISGRIKLPTLIHLLQHFHSVSSLRRMLVSNGADLVEVKGAGFVTALHLLGDRLLPSRWMEGIYRWCSPLEDRLSRHSQLAGLSLHMAIRAVKCNPGSPSAR